jgi:prolycopene isomerase
LAERFDAIVVGGGLGGLAAAATLARAGRRVRLFERHTQPGGYATTFVRDRFEFEVALHELSAIGTPDNRGSLYRLLEELGIVDRIGFVPIPHLFRTVAPDMDVRVPVGRDAALDSLCAAFPKERAGLTRLFERMDQVKREADALGEMTGAPLSPAGVFLRYPTLAHAAGVTLGAVVDRELSDPRAKLAYCQLWPYFGLPPSKLSYLLYAVAFVVYLRWGACGIQGKSQRLSNAFADIIREAGGRVTLGTGVRRILVEGGKIRGVVTDAGEEFETDFVVSNADPVTTCTKLIDPREVPEAWFRRVAGLRPSLSSFCVYLGLHRDCRELGITDHELYVNDTTDMDAQYESAFRVEPPGSFLICTYNATDPAFSPPGTAVMTLAALSSGRVWADVTPADYPRRKLALAKEMVRRAERVIPGLSDSIETSVVSTPLTNMRYTGNPEGALYGFENTPSENPGLRLDQRGPIDGLWFAGAWTQPGGGYHPCILSGHEAARAILARQA